MSPGPIDTTTSPVVALADRLPWRSRVVRRWRVVVAVLSIVLVAVVTALKASDVTWALGRFRHIAGGRLGIAIVFEIVSLAMVAVVQRRLFRQAGADISRTRAVAVAYAQAAIALSAPGGPLLSNTYVYHEFRRRGLNEVVTAWILGTIAVVSTIALTVVTIVGARDTSSFGAASVATTFLALAVLSLLLVGAVAPLRLAVIVVPTLHVWRALFRRPTDPYATWSQFATRLGTMHLRVRDWVTLFTASMINWAADCVCFILCARALHAHVSVTGVVLAYAAGQAIVTLPLTPGGFGLFEVAVPAALVAAGVHQRTALAIVLLYRFISFWGVLVIGWACWAVLRWMSERQTYAG